MSAGRGSGGRGGDDNKRRRSGASKFPVPEDTVIDVNIADRLRRVVETDASVPQVQALTNYRRPLLVRGSSSFIPKGMAAEDQFDQFREVRTRLEAMAASFDLRYFTTLVVSMTPGAGVSFVARNLAAAFTLQGRRAAVLMDCNVRNPTQHLALGSRPDGGGLFDYLTDPTERIEHLICPTAIAGLHLIPAGHPSSRFREYFSSPAMRLVMSELRNEPSCVFMDGPPALGSPDARILSEFADFVVLVVGYGRGKPDEIAQAAALFDPAKFAGAIFNQRA